MHLPAQYECMPRGAERENRTSGESQTGYTWTKEKLWDGQREKKQKNPTKTLKLQYETWRTLSTREREEWQNKIEW